MTAAPTEPVLCHRCGSTLTPGEGSFHIVRIEAFADPSPPSVPDAESYESMVAAWEETLADLSQMSERELMDQVYRRLVATLCGRCYRRWIENPFS